MTNDQIINIFIEAKGDTKLLEKKANNLLKKESRTMTVLGVDVFEYSKMDNAKQFFVPFIINMLFNKAVDRIKEKETLFFSEDDLIAIKKTKIDTGDGFFLIFENPMKALIFLCHFCIEIEILQSRNSFSGLMKLVNDYIFRYSISTGDIFTYDDNNYGNAIIKCSRIIALDKLNRFLMDKESYIWFYNNSNGMETLKLMTSSEIKMHQTQMLFYENGNSLIIPEKRDMLAIENLIIQKIGVIQSKKDCVDVYSIFIQLKLFMTIENNNNIPLVTSIGNLNTAGLFDTKK